MTQFNEGQRKAIEHVEGPMIALAGPGSGKTTAMVYRIKYLIEKKHINPARILVITFTRASAKEMEERFHKLMNHADVSCTFGTFHSVFFYILKIAYGYTTANILKEDEKYEMFRQLIREQDIACEDEDDLLRSLIQEVSIIKGDMISLEHFYSSCVSDEMFKEIYREYEKRVSALGKLDFDDMMVYCYELLKERSDILKKLQNMYSYILVDEFQDINKIQYEITKMLAKPKNNLFIVGDDDQSIYGFRGSRPEIMLHFKDDYPDAKTSLLDINYRCSRNITEGALRLIQHNSIRYEKKIISQKDYEEPIYIHHMKNVLEENMHVRELINKYTAQGIKYQEMAVIVRTNIQARSIVNQLIAYNIPFQVRDKVPCIYDHFTVKMVLDYIRFAMGIRDRALFLRVMNKPNRYLARECVTESVVSWDGLRKAYAKKDWAVDKINQMEYDIKILAGLKPFPAVHFIRKAIGLDEYLKEYAQFRHIRVEDLYEVLDELQEMAKQYKTFAEWFEGIEEYQRDYEAYMQMGRKAHNGVVITTMHSAKGLEFSAVFILEVNEGFAPYKKSVKPEEIEEERRMFYVAMTRAKSKLHLYEVKEYYNKELEPSRFLSEITTEKRDTNSI